MSRFLSMLLALMLVAGRAEAQGFRPLVKYGKWVTLAASIGMNYLAHRDHDRADNVFHDLESRCVAARNRCNLGPSGSYLDREIETLYQASLHYDRRARGWLIGGEISPCRHRRDVRVGAYSPSGKTRQHPVRA